MTERSFENMYVYLHFQPQDYVIALHSKYVFSFAPAEVLDTYTNDSCKVEFFDGCVSKLTNTDVYKVSKAKYKKVVDYIKERERRLVGKSVVARDDDTGLYRLGNWYILVQHLLLVDCNNCKEKCWSNNFKDI